MCPANAGQAGESDTFGPPLIHFAVLTMGSTLEVDARAFLAHDVPDKGVGDEGAELVQGRCQGLALERLGVAGELLDPELAHHRIADRGDDLAPQLLVGEEAVEEEERRPRVGRHGENSVSEHVLEARSP